MKTILHYPDNNKENEDIKIKLAYMKADIIISSIKSMNCPYEQRKLVFNTLMSLLNDKV